MKSLRGAAFETNTSAAHNAIIAYEYLILDAAREARTPIQSKKGHERRMGKPIERKRGSSESHNKGMGKMGVTEAYDIKHPKEKQSV